MALRVLVTGATGFVGVEAARALIRAGHRVTALVRGPEPGRRLEQVGVAALPLPGDLEDPGAMRSALADSDAVVHLAALVDPALQGDRHAVFRMNRDRTLELARIARGQGVRRFVFMSSIAAMGFRSGVARADSPCLPGTPYGQSKREAELGLLALRRSSFEPLVLRPPTVYGPGETYNFLAWARAVDRGLFRIVGRGDNHFPLATSANVARAVAAAVEGQLGFPVTLVADRDAYTLSRIDRALRGALGRGPAVRIPKGAAAAAALANELAHGAWSRIPLVLGRARLRTLTVDQRFDVTPLLAAGVKLDAPLEEWVAMTIRDQRGRGLLPRRD